MKLHWRQDTDGAELIVSTLWYSINPLDTWLSSLNFFSCFVLHWAAAENQNNWSLLVGNASLFQPFIPLTWVFYFLIVSPSFPSFPFFLNSLLFLSIFCSLFNFHSSLLEHILTSLRQPQTLPMAPHRITHTHTHTHTHTPDVTLALWQWSVTMIRPALVTAGVGSWPEMETIGAVGKGKY